MLAEVQEKTPSFLKRMMLGEDVRKLVPREQMHREFNATHAVLDPVLTKLESLNKKVTAMHALAVA